jgi:hypothetical protein
VTLEQITAIVGVLFMLLVGLVAWVFKDALNSLRESIREIRGKDAAYPIAVLEEKVRALESDYELLHQHKNVILPARLDQLYAHATAHSDRSVQELGRRVELLERARAKDE